MPALSSAQPSATGPASSAPDSEEARADFQARLATFGLALGLLAGIAWAALALVYLVSSGGDVDQYPPFSPGNVCHLAGALVSGGLWLATRRGRLPAAVLDALDIIAALAITGLFTAAGGLQPVPMVAVFVSVLSFNTGMLTRAIMVPSTARRTLGLGLFGAAMLVAFAIWHKPPGASVVQMVVPVLCWASVGVAVGTLASHTIYGLRREVREAQVLGQYRLEAKIGEGGMGEVWRASHALLRRATAVKLLPPDRMGPEASRRFEREVQLTARLTHPGTVAIYDYGRTRDGIFYYAMELLDGTDLERLVRRTGPQPPGRVVHILSQVCGALAEAHDLGLVHRDVKPANILLSPRSGEHEFAKILDFGLVKSLEGPADASITAASSITGTPLYMSPEAIRAPGSVDGRSDLYALGAVAWFLLVGRPPFAGQNLLDVCSRHLQTPPDRPSAALGRALPVDLEDAVLACLEKQPEARPPGARALRERLESCSAAGRWTAAEAAAWWEANPASSAGDPEPGLARTIALDVGLRETAAPPAARGL